MPAAWREMKNLRTYGKAPFRVAVIHGGPGAPGSMAPVARQLAGEWGVLEPLQTANSIEGQVAELAAVLKSHGSLPVALIGSSWGAWLSVITAARHPQLVRQLILVGSGPFEARYAEGIMATRLSRLGADERREVQTLLERLGHPASDDRDNSLDRLGNLLAKTDAYDPLPPEEAPGELMADQAEIYRNVWAEASELRRSGRLLGLANQIRCPVLAIHGDYDPHPFEGVRDPLARLLGDFRFILLPSCGHEPWRERQARDHFYGILRRELRERAPPDGTPCQHPSA